MTRLDINPDDLLLIQSLLKKWAPDALILAYGSRVKGTSHEGSDLDLVIKNKRNPEEPSAELFDLKLAFSESTLPILVDLMDWAYLPTTYQDEINKLNVAIQPYTARGHKLRD